MESPKNKNSFFYYHSIRIFYKITALCYSSLFVYVLFFARRRRNLTGRYITIIPLKSTITNFLNIHGNEHHELFNYYSNLIGNIILFLPLPIFLACLGGIRSFKKSFLISFIFSLSIELLQYIFKRGVADIDDILLNQLGTIIGFFTYHFFLRQEAKS